MSGHSKWSTIKHQKGAADKKRANLFTKLAAQITVAAKELGGDPATNFKLRLAVDRAKSANMPKDNIDRAIKRGTGEAVNGVVLEELTYEGFGPGGVAFVVKVLTDNRNRSAADIRHIFSKYNGNLGENGSVMWMFKKRGVIQIAKEDFRKNTADDIELLAIENDAEDIRREDEGITIFTAADKLSNAKDALEQNGVTITDANVTLVATSPADVDNETKEKNIQLIDALDGYDDIVSVASNLDT